MIQWRIRIYNVRQGINMDIYWHELNAYKYEIDDISAKIEAFRKDNSCVDNVTHFGIGLSNRALLIVVGLCALVEIRLFELAEEEESRHQFKVDDLAGQGLTRLQKYLSKSQRIDCLQDIRARARIQARIERLALGNPGDVKPVGEGISEM
nr:hypothetical protein [Candidatus Chlorobium masyuteum]